MSLEHEIRYDGAVFESGSAAPPFSLTLRRGAGVQIVANDPDRLLAFCLASLGLKTLHSGTILIDGQDLAEMDRGFLRRSAAFISSDLLLPSGNLAGVLDVESGPEISQRSELLAEFGIDTLVGRLPLGWATPIFEGGRWLEPVDRFRLLVVRALFSQPRLVVVDRALDSLPLVAIDAFVDHMARRSSITVVTSTRQEGLHPGLDLTPLDAVRSGVRGHHLA